MNINLEKKVNRIFLMPKLGIKFIKNKNEFGHLKNFLIKL